MAYHPLRQTDNNTKHWRAERNRIATLRLTLQQQRSNRAAHRVGQNIAFTPRSRHDLLLPEGLQIVNVVIKIIDMAAVSVGQDPSGAPLPAMVNDQHVKTEMKQIVGKLGIFNIAFNTSWADDDHPIVLGGMKAHKTHRNIANASEFSLFTLPPEIGQGSVRESRKGIFSCFPPLFLPKHWVSAPGRL